jgi:hypothetical protein
VITSRTAARSRTPVSCGSHPLPDRSPTTPKETLCPLDEPAPTVRVPRTASVLWRGSATVAGARCGPECRTLRVGPAAARRRRLCRRPNQYRGLHLLGSRWESALPRHRSDGDDPQRSRRGLDCADAACAVGPLERQCPTVVARSVRAGPSLPGKLRPDLQGRPNRLEIRPGEEAKTATTWVAVKSTRLVLGLWQRCRVRSIAGAGGRPGSELCRAGAVARASRTAR